MSFNVCIDSETKNLLIKALQIRIDLLIENKASEKVIEKNKFLIEDIDKMDICKE